MRTPRLQTCSASGQSDDQPDAGLSRSCRGAVGSDASAAIFTEPNLAFSVANYNTHSALIRLHLSLESVPPWIDSDTVDN